ncbi:MAG: helix-turn-helix transcriptional regulator [Eubacteriales bacterium]|nr:helix-turn-helix transcriptional regulator [Eubacteriales bacterium]
MFKLKAPGGSNNICGRNIAKFRQAQDLSQRKLAQKMQVMGYDIDNHVIRRIEIGERFVTDIELKALTAALEVSYQELLD